MSGKKSVGRHKRHLPARLYASGSNRAKRFGEIVDKLTVIQVRMDALEVELRALYATVKKEFGLSPVQVDLLVLRRRASLGREPRTDSVVYFLESPTNGRVKIGFTTDLTSRLRAISTAAGGIPLRLVGTIGGGRMEERALHHQFHEHRRAGEFFDWEPIKNQIAGLIARNSALLPEHLQ